VRCQSPADDAPAEGNCPGSRRQIDLPPRAGPAALAVGGSRIDGLGHRMAMSFAVAGLHCSEPIGIAGMSATQTSFPGFRAALAALTGA